MSNSEWKKRLRSSLIPRINLFRIFAERHVRQVEKPANLEIVGKQLEVFGEVLDRESRTAGIGMDGRRRDRQDARAFAPAHDAIVVFAAPHGDHALHVHDSGQVFKHRSGSCKPVEQISQNLV